MKQIDLFTKKSNRFGGNKRTTRASRTHRPITTRQTMHLVLKSKQAKGDWSFLKPRNKAIIAVLLKKYSKVFGVKIFSSANVGNHLHLHAKFHSHHAYKSFIRVLSGAIALKITGASKINKLKDRFWTQTPYSRFVFGVKDFLRISDYIKVNQLEGFGHPRGLAEGVVKNWDYLYDGFV
ncbi:MAG: transposase [Bdellovibrionota bacterium]